jgi:multimeric flavodoxin WrbA
MEAEISSKTKILVLNGTGAGAKDLSRILSVLTAVLKQNATQVQVFSPGTLKLTHCIGCFGCWLETPGICRFKEPAYQEMFKAWVQSDVVVMLTPVCFGSYSSTLKIFIDRILPVLQPFFQNYHGEIHHLPRYTKRPRLIGIGVQDTPNAGEAGTFRLLVGRHAIDMIAPSYAAEVINSNDDDEHLRKALALLLDREDVFPRGNAIKNILMPIETAISADQTNKPQRACLIIGSPKTLSNSSSSIVGNYVLERMKHQGWETNSLTIKPNLLTNEGQANLYSCIDNVDLLIIAFPLYIDTLPFLLTRALELIANHRRENTSRRPVRVFILVNNGFPESYQSNVALAVCRHFAVTAGMTWAGALTLGAGEAIVGGEPLKQKNDMGIPLFKIHQTLQNVADDLAQNRSVSIEAIHKLAGGPIPYTPFFIWKFMFIRGANGFWVQRATKNGVSKQQMRARPFESAAAS